MKKRIAVCLTAVFASLVCWGQTSVQDSLAGMLHSAADRRARIGLLLSLTDVASDAGSELKYARILFDEARAEGDAFALGPTLAALTNHFLGMGPSGLDSLEIYLRKAGQVLEGTSSEGLTEYYRMVARARDIQVAERADVAAVCDRYTAELQRSRSTESRYGKTARLFLTGVISYKLMELSGKVDWSVGMPYWEEAWESLQGFPLMSRKNFAANLLICLLKGYSQQSDSARLIDASDTYLRMLDQYYSQAEIVSRRPFIDKETSYQVCYHSLITSDGVIGKSKAHEYYLRYSRFLHSGAAGEFMRSKVFFYSLSRRHYNSLGDYRTALAYNDSLIGLFEKGEALVMGPVDHYFDRARLLRALGRSGEACEAYERAAAVADSLRTHEYLDKVGELRIEYETDKLELANSRLIAQKRATTLRFALGLLAVVLAVSVYLYLGLRREKRLKAEILRQSLRAQESDRMKSAFVNLICHEIRTPLNAITGFAEIVADESVGADEKAGLSDIIRRNTGELLSMIDGLLETSNLDSSSDRISTSPTDAVPVCRSVMRRFLESPSHAEVEFRLDIPYPQCTIEVNAGYFERILSILLDNADKYTCSGWVTLACRIDEAARTACFTVTDTGCGIPPDKREEVFGRFAKLDTFSPGAGLGLYLGRLIARRMGGDLRVDDGYDGGGARFVLTVRLSEEASVK